MCFPFDAIVPDLPPGFQVIGGGAAGERLTLTSTDGTEFSAYLARAEGPTGVVILPDVRGLFRFYEELAERFAAAGHPAIAFDYFGRTAGLGPRDEAFEWRPHIEQSTPEHVAQDVAAAIEALDAERVVTVGFCFGGSMSFHQAAEGHAGLAGAVGFYGGLSRRGVIERAPDAKVPVLGLFAGDDESIPQHEIDAFDAALPVEHEIHVYPGAPHSFFDRRAEQYASESQDAWERILGFISKLEAA
ncbi:dienelactone hydrolase family protein [Solirubrobacter phytolaccae]|uniref:Dienelactone hydrolase family protein n=1 Tax=Solirubrobacter phytolaccae TaxID=1404360 RepID=A0A9X3S9G1_9ACTN|nr:dienelactone hydrolase family protein [Solirubrobacter phytolaccae]MDA0182598.1 dienelactone hydrolase family protein [Solirubrobacter phytolaccae]